MNLKSETYPPRGIPVTVWRNEFLVKFGPVLHGWGVSAHELAAYGIDTATRFSVVNIEILSTSSHISEIHEFFAGTGLQFCSGRSKLEDRKGFMFKDGERFTRSRRLSVVGDEFFVKFQGILLERPVTREKLAEYGIVVP